MYIYMQRESKITHLRKVSVLTAISIGDGCVHLMAKARQSLEKCERQLHKDTKKANKDNAKSEKEEKEEEQEEHEKGTSKARTKHKKSAKMSKLEESVADFKQRIDALKKLTTFIFENMISYKSKDSHFEIRMWTLNCITEWVNADPSPTSFFNDTYWRYLQEALTDQVSPTISF
ncbi:hypothetical protein RFI_30367 [Reticulomyxa filosa]|uniref:Uncharacterized protein n=1 Tax=Reticulomyxa filosa TaxID=46433 RepID=X6M096_RETFI|nr:hypothetical protein RFI_30367 [Reticulomyxa filosa]|eukprot:ETO07026.1 hypothetical protein RFI_30367 [Reticulomyxa filosa]